MNTCPHVNKSRVKQTALDVAAGHRKMSDGSPRFTRVSASFLEKIESAVRNAITSEVHKHPGTGKTLQ